MTYPPPSGGPNDPWSQPSAPPADPTLAMGQPIPTQPAGPDPYAPFDPYTGAKSDQAPAAGGDPYAAPGYAPPGYAPPGYPGYGYPAAQKTNGMAIAALVLSLVGIASCITAPIGAILGHVARKQIRESGEGGEGMAKAAIIVGWILTGLFVLLIIFYVVIIVLAVATADTGGSTPTF
ncbi:DUF4190 domain-containing protein [Micromonospora olivasterospora]|uniref:Uncharacterized protein DUF4190 n=1 Tax=Micromonospora olivasterospora TaxID=1880 RepID=A0A562IB43_MICOL|nr:DUF4190 domain-containing protein [Micromonospora olivasterospora]TWH68217.1 uncharacterized protein DUF4190 [Micromonospora olivasterospora]